MSSRVPVKPKPFELQLTAKAGRPYAPFLQRKLRDAAKLMRTRLQHVSIALVGDQLMSDLHVQFMNIAGPTDVLTFELEHDVRGHVTEGEIVLCVPEARRQAREHGTRIEHELLLYGIHGLLHLNGYDDQTEADFRAIHREEDRILVALKIGPVFKPTTGPVERSRAKGARKPASDARRKKDGRSR